MVFLRGYNNMQVIVGPDHLFESHPADMGNFHILVAEVTNGIKYHSQLSNSRQYRLSRKCPLNQGESGGA